MIGWLNTVYTELAKVSKYREGLYCIFRVFCQKNISIVYKQGIFTDKILVRRNLPAQRVKISTRRIKQHSFNGVVTTYIFGSEAFKAA